MRVTQLNTGFDVTSGFKDVHLKGFKMAIWRKIAHQEIVSFQ